MAEESLKNKTKKGIFWTTINSFFSYGIQFVIGIVMARMLTPDDYGIAALPAVFLAIAGVFIDSGFSGAMIRKPELTEHDLSTSLYYSLSVGIACYFIIYICSPWIAEFYKVPVLKELIRWAALSFLITPLTTPQNIILNRRLDFKTPTVVGFISQLCMGICGVLLAYYGYGVWALVLSSLLSNFLNFLLRWLVVRWYPQTGWSIESFRYLWGYGNKLVASYLIGHIYENIVPVVIGKYYSTASLGEYNRAQGYCRLVAANTTNIIQQVTFPVLSKMLDDEETLRKNYRRIIRTSAFVIFPLMMLLAALAKPIIILMLTEKWEGCILLLQLMCFSMMWYPVHAINLNLLQVKGRTDLFLKLEIIKKSYGLIAMIITLPISVVAVVLSSWVTNILSLLVNTYYTQKIIQVGFIRQMKDVAPSLLASFVIFLVILFIESFISSYIIQVIIGGTIGLLVYIGIAYIFHFTELEDLKFLLKKSKIE